MTLQIVPSDVQQIIINFLLIKDASRYMITNKTLLELVKNFYIGNLKNKIKCPLKDWFNTFPNAKKINIERRRDITGLDFSYLSKIEILDMHLCTHSSIDDYTFKNLLKLKHIDLQGCFGHNFTDKAFIHFKNLETFYIDNNQKITDKAFHNLIKIKNLTIHNCSNITTNGLSNLTTLVKLNIYNLYNLDDDVFKKLSNLKELDMTFGNITDIGISYLHNLKKLKILSCKNIKCIDFDKLTK